MGRKRRRRRGDLERRPAFRDPLPNILVVCEGEVTEPGYLRAFAADQKNGLVDVEPIGLKGNPKGLVDEAIRRKIQAAGTSAGGESSGTEHDAVWCLFDVDSRPKERRVPEARQAARSGGISLGISNPSFELWALLHFQEYDRPSTQREVHGALKRHLPSSDKRLPYDSLAPKYDDAVRHTKSALRNRRDEGTPDGNPSTTVHLLMEIIRRHGRKHRLKADS